jgi:hypothetical protein
MMFVLRKLITGILQNIEKITQIYWLTILLVVF